MKLSSIEEANHEGADNRSKLESLGLFISTIAHSIKGLCTGLDGGIYLINSGEETGDAERRQRGWSMIQRNANRLRRLVNNTLYYGKERSLELIEVDVNEIHAEVVETLENKARRLGIELKTAIREPLHPLRADISALTAALVNLVENALDACAADSMKTKHAVELLTQMDEDSILFLIRDNGIGMDLNTTNNATALFFSSKGAVGTGLGLFIAEQIASSHGGALSIQSSIGEGTTIALTLPRNESSMQKRKEVTRV